jgi:hypothetical protein
VTFEINTSRLLRMLSDSVSTVCECAEQKSG